MSSVTVSPEDKVAADWWVYQYKAAELLRIHQQTLRQMIRDGEIETVVVGRRRVIRVSEIERLRKGLAAS